MKQKTAEDFSSAVLMYDLVFYDLILLCVFVLVQA